MPKVFLGIDAGTSGVKVCVFSPDGEVVGKAQKPVHLVTPYPTWAELDIDNYWQVVVAAAREALKNFDDVAAIGISSTCPTTIFMDENVRPLRPGILYLDRRSDERVRRFARDNGGDAALFRRTGNHPFSSTCWLGNIHWVKENEPALWAKTKHIGLLSTFLAHRITGRLTMDWTQASYSGGFNIYDPEKGWDAELLAAWGVDPAMLPEVGWSCKQAGELAPAAAEAFGIKPGAVVAFGSADTAAASFAVGLKNAGDVFESAGTSGVMTFCLDKPDFDEAFMNRCHIFPNRWLAHGAMSTLGGAFGWLKNKIWPEVVSVAELEQLAAESIPGANGLVFLPYLAGERSPIWDPEASGVWLGLRLDSTRADMVRAVFEGAAFGLRQITERATRHWGWKPKHILSVGGGSRSRFWAQIKADIMGVEYHITNKPDAAAWGAALLGAVAAGDFSGPDDPAIHFVGANRKPPATSRSERVRLHDLERVKAYDKAFKAYEKVYPALRSVMHDLANNK